MLHRVSPARTPVNDRLFGIAHRHGNGLRLAAGVDDGREDAGRDRDQQALSRAQQVGMQVVGGAQQIDRDAEAARDLVQGIAARDHVMAVLNAVAGRQLVESFDQGVFLVGRDQQVVRAVRGRWPSAYSPG